MIPEAFLTDLATPALLAVIAFALAALVKGADWLVGGASALAHNLGMPSVIVGATIVSLGTTMPECAVSVLAAWSNRPGLALGNAVGSIIADTGLIFGGCALMANLPADRYILTRQGWVQFASAVLLAAICYGSFVVSGPAAAVGRLSGALFLTLLVVYLIASVRWSQHYARVAGGEPAPGGDRSALRQVTDVIVGVALVVLSSDALIDAVEILAIRLGVPEVVIAGTLVAFGTSLPELIVGVTAVRKKQLGILVGNVIGADVLNVLFVIGASAVAAPLPVVDQAASLPEIFLVIHLPTMLAMLILFRIFIHRATRVGQFSRAVGVPLVALYVAYTAVQFWFGRAA